MADRAEPMLLFNALLDSLRSRPGSLLVLEDLHWADDASLDLLRFLGRRLTDVAALVLATHRDDELGRDHPLRALLGDYCTAPPIRRLSVAPLSRAAVGALAAGSGVDAGLLWQRTGGNPFFVTEVLATGGDAVPASVFDAVLARAGRVSPAARDLLDVVAVLDTAADIATLREVIGPSGGELDRCVEVGLLVVVNRAVKFRHELARMAVLSAIPPGRRVELHRAVLRALDVSNTSPAVLAHHAEGAADQEQTRRWAERAAIQAARVGAHRQASAHYQQSLRALPVAASSKRAELLVRCSRECAESDRIAEAIAEAEDALLIWRAIGERLREGDTLAWLAQLAWTSDRIAEAVNIGRSATALLGVLPPSKELARAHATVARLLSLHYAHPEAEDWARKALTLAKRVGADDIAVRVAIDLGTVLAMRGDRTGRPRIEEAIARAQAIGAHDSAAFGMLNLVRLASGGSRHDQVREIATAAKAFCADYGLVNWENYIRAVESQDLLHQGRWSEAEAIAAELWRGTTKASPASRVAIVCTTLGLVRRRRGDPDPDRLLQVAAERLRGAPIVGPVLELAAARAEQAWLHGQLGPLASELRTLWEIARAREGWWVDELHWWLTVAEEGSAQEWRTAAERWTERGQPYHRALAFAESTEEASLREALTIAHDLKAQPLARLITRRLRALGATGLKRGFPALASTGPLSAREHQVLDLLAEGLRDAEIAERLHLSERTVNHHVSAVLRKLTAPSRTAAVACAFRDGLLRPR
jgi:DNA-binding CsgD family transcriptional regulator/tetratricopeptide (TPR) repeat protein